jgi:predicted DsbA family dithiol-disulfide isomerase
MVVEVWGDFICPWCWIGKQRFEAALNLFEQRDSVQIVHRAFRLMPGMNPQPLSQMMQQRFGASAHVQMISDVTRTAKSDGMDCHLDNALAGDTYDAHRLVRYAAQQADEAPLVGMLYAAYFTQQKSIFDQEQLIRLAAAAGIDPEGARAVLASNAHAEEVEADLRMLQSAGISGVPFFALDGRVGVSGAQSSDHFLAALRHAWNLRPDEQHAAGTTGDASGAACSATTAQQAS